MLLLSTCSTKKPINSSQSKMPALLEEIKEILKLPPKLRFQKLNELRARLRWLTKQEEEKRKLEEEDIVRKTIEEIKLEEEDEEKHLKEEIKKPAEETLEKIAEEAPARKPEPRTSEYFAGTLANLQQSKPRTADEIYSTFRRIEASYQKKGELTEMELAEARQARDEFYQKKQAGYVPPDEKTSNLMNRTSEMLDEFRDRLRRREDYR